MEGGTLIMGRPASTIPFEVRNKVYQKKYRDTHPEKRKETKERWRKANMEKSRAYSLKTRYKYLEESRERDRLYAKAHPEVIAKKNAARKARLYGAVREYYNRLEIYERDGGVCCICFEPIDLSYPPRHTLSFTIQHHTPLSLGGADAPDNIGIAHYSCNSRVGNRKVTYAR